MNDVEGLTNEKRARTYLANRLARGEIALFLGAGVSMDVGFPGWAKLVRRCGILAGVSRKTLREKLGQMEFAAVTDQVRASQPGFDEYADIVQRALYHRLKYDLELARSRLLTSLGSLVSGGGRGRVRTIVTLNFDDIVEWYLSLHGYRTQSVWSLPWLLDSEAVKVYHAHGFLPRPDGELGRRRSDFLVFSRKSADERIGGEGRPWWQLMSHVLESKVCLFIGMSEQTASDYVLTPLLSKVAASIAGQRPTGFWTFRRPLEKQVQERLLDYNVVPLEFETHADTAAFLLSVCSEARWGVHRPFDQGTS